MSVPSSRLMVVLMPALERTSAKAWTVAWSGLSKPASSTGLTGIRLTWQRLPAISSTSFRRASGCR